MGHTIGKKMEICQKIDVFHKIHTVKTLFVLTSALAIKCHIVRNIMLKTGMIYLSTEKRNKHFCMTEKKSKNFIPPKGVPKMFLDPKLVNFIFWSISLSLKLIWTRKIRFEIFLKILKKN